MVLSVSTQHVGKKGKDWNQRFNILAYRKTNLDCFFFIN